MSLEDPSVLLVNSYTKRFPWELKRLGHPLSLLSIGTYLTKVLGIKTEILDATAINFNNDIQLSTSKIRFGLNPDEFKEEIARKLPDIVLFSNQISCQYSSLIECASLVKEVSKRIIVGVGGIHVSALPEEILQSDYIDFIFLGEENILDDFFLALSGRKEYSELKSFGYKRQGKSFINKEKCFVKNLKDIPIYNFSLLDESLYTINAFHNGKSNAKFVDIVTERCCPYKCNFCATGNRDSPYRTFSIAQIDSLFFELKSRGYNQILNEDDIGFFSRKHLIQIMKLYSKYNFTWQQVHGVSPNQIKKELIEDLVNSNCEKIYLAVESSNLDFRIKVFNKPRKLSSYDDKDILTKIGLLNDNGIKVDVGFIIGHPDQTLEDIKTDIEFGKILKDGGANFVMPWILTILPGTPFWKTLSRYRVGDYDDCNMMTGNIKNECFDPTSLRSIQQNAIEYINNISFNNDFLINGWDSCSSNESTPQAETWDFQVFI